MTRSSPRCSRLWQWLKASPMVACLGVLIIILAYGAQQPVSFADGNIQHKHKTALQIEQEGLLDPEASDTDNDLLTSPHADHGKLSAQRSADEISQANIGKAIVQQMTPTAGGIWQYAPELPAGFYPIHTIVMTRGVLLVAGSGNSEQAHDMHMYKTYYCSPLLRGCRSIPTPADLFCGDMAQDVYGSAVMAGGTGQWGSKGWTGARWVYEFRESTLRWKHVANTKLGRWYPTTVLQINGKFLIISGLDQNGKLAKKTETYDPKTKKIGSTKGKRKFPLYGRFWPTAVEGRYFFDGTGYGGVVGDVPPGYWYPKTNKFKPIKGLRIPDRRSSGASCSIGDYSAQTIITFGGGAPATNAVDKITLRGTPRYTAAAPMGAAKQFVSCVTLPNTWVFEVGGGSANRIQSASPEASLYKSATGPRTPVNSLPTGEYFLYHNNLVVLDDCRYVALFGSNPGAQARNTHVLFWTPPTQVNGCPAAPKMATTIPRGKVRVSVPAGTAYLSVQVPNMVTHSKDNGGRVMKVAVKNGVADFSRIKKQFVAERKVKIRAINTRGTWSNAINVTFTS